MKVCVFGAGAVGSHLALRSHLGGATTSVIARGTQLEAISKRGIRVLASGEELHASVTASDNPAVLGQQDVVIVTVKAPALGSVARTIGPLLGPETAVLFAMNGLPWWYFHDAGGQFDGLRLPTIDPGGAVWNAVGPARALGGVVYTPCALTEPGIVRLASQRNRLVVGEPSGETTPRINAIASVLTSGGLQTDVSTSIRTTIWEKLINNITSGVLAVLTQSTVERIAAEPPCEQAMRTIMAEALAVANAVGCSPSVDVEQVIGFMKTLKHKPSILQDLERSSPMEIESMFGIVRTLAAKANTPTPTLDLLITLATLRAEAAGLHGPKEG